MSYKLLSLSGLLLVLVGSVVSGMPPLPPPPHPEAFFGGGMKRSAGYVGGAAMPAPPPLPLLPSKRAPPAAQIKTDLPGEHLSPADFKNAVTMNLPQYEAGGQKVDPIELAALFEGDIIIESDPAHPTQRNGIDNNRRWSNGIVPYIISSSYDKKERAIIARAILSFHKSTCLRFIPHTTEEDYINIVNGDNGCASSVGRVGGAQELSLGVGCIFTGIVMHELMHTVGFFHEHSRKDRDSYITINYDNIQEGMEHNFRKLTGSSIQGIDFDYDYDSIMHFSQYAFARNSSKPTIIPHKTGVKIGQRMVFSKTDIRKLNILYECDFGLRNSGEGNSSVVTPSPVNLPQPNNCSDNNQYCSQWASMGECEKNTAWMNINCNKSCNQCEAPCEDQNPHCGDWDNKGECTKNSEYMTLYCKKTCGACHDEDDQIAEVS
ncbi:unnamed protein product, partial [Meganyctiphanes norvegica]